MTASSEFRFVSRSAFSMALIGIASVACASKTATPSSAENDQNAGLVASAECAGKACGSDCSPPGSDEPFNCTSTGRCAATPSAAELACKACAPFVGDCKSGEAPADLDGDGCVDGCKPTSNASCDGVVVGGVIHVASADGKECTLPSTHCLTKNPLACPQLNPAPAGWCSGTIVAGPTTYQPSADGKECELASLHCITKDVLSCPQISPRAPDWCAGGTVASGPARFVASADGKECQLSGELCLTNDLTSCPQR